MKRLKYLSFLIFVIFWACSSRDETPSPWLNRLSVEQNVAKNVIVLNSSEDFSFLDKIVRNRSVVILGEGGHFDYSTSEVKIKMIHYLQGKGFNSIALEGAPLLVCYLFSNPKYAEFTKNWKIENFWGLQNNQNKVYQPFFKLVQERKLKVWGIDCCMSHWDIDAVKKILHEYSEPKRLQVDWEKLKILYFRKFVQIKYLGCPECPAGEISVDEQYDLMRMIDSISNYTQYLISLNGATTELKLILQWIRNLNTEFFFVDYSGSWDIHKTLFPYRNRDSQMAENINWIVENFPEERFTVWCANFHGAKDISQTRHPADSLQYFVFQTMGETVCSRHGDKIYPLAFTSLYPSPEDRGNLEEEISLATGNAPYAFINFETLRFADGYRDKEFESSVINKKRGKWLYIFDGLYYIRDQERDVVPVPK